jgi:hypothetical protein
MEVFKTGVREKEANRHAETLQLTGKEDGSLSAR